MHVYGSSVCVKVRVGGCVWEGVGWWECMREVCVKICVCRRICVNARS